MNIFIESISIRRSKRRISASMWNINSTSKRLLNGNQSVIRSESLKKQYLAGCYD